MFYGQLHTAFLLFHFRASFLRFATSFNNVRFVSLVSISAHHSPPAAHNFCVPFGLLRLRFCHTFCKEEKKQKRYAKPLRQRCCPTHSVLSGHPLCKCTPPDFRYSLHRLHSGTLRLRWTSLPPRLNCLFWLKAVFT